MFVLFYDNVFFVGVCGVWVDVWFWCVMCGCVVLAFRVGGVVCGVVA